VMTVACLLFVVGFSPQAQLATSGFSPQAQLSSRALTAPLSTDELKQPLRTRGQLSMRMGGDPWTRGPGPRGDWTMFGNPEVRDAAQRRAMRNRKSLDTRDGPDTRDGLESIWVLPDTCGDEDCAAPEEGETMIGEQVEIEAKMETPQETEGASASTSDRPAAIHHSKSLLRIEAMDAIDDVLETNGDAMELTTLLKLAWVKEMTKQRVMKQVRDDDNEKA